MKFFAEIRKVDEEKRMVYGYATTEALDSQGEVIKLDAVKDAWGDYMKFANVREMHQPSAVGIVKEYSFDDKGVEIGAKVVDDDAWAKVKEKVYKGFSIGGKKLEKMGEEVTRLMLTEISLVDRPANPEAMISMFKRDESAEPPKEKTPEEIAKAAAEKAIDDAMAELAGIMEKSKMSHTDLLALVKAHVDRPAVPEVKKGMYTVAQAASLLEQLDYLQAATEFESRNEGDNSAIPGQIREVCKMLGEALKALVVEEVDEMNGGGESMAMSDDPTTLIKFPKEFTKESVEAFKGATKGQTKEIIQKAAEALGAQIVKIEKPKAKLSDELLGKLHDFAAKHGIICWHKKSDALNGALEKLDKLDANLQELAKKNTELSAELEKVKAMPLPPKGNPRGVVMNKADEITANLGADGEVQPIKKNDGTVDEPTTLIKSIHAKGGVPFGQR